MHGRAPLLPCERRAIVPGTFQSGFPEVPCHSPSPLSLSPSYFFTHSLFARPFFLDPFFPTETVSCVTISQTAFHATQTHILVSLSPVSLPPPLSLPAQS